MAERPSVSLILPAYNEVHAIAETINEAAEFFRRCGMTYEIIVSADGDDGTRELVGQLARSDPHLKVTGSLQRLGKGHGLKRGVAVASGRVIGYLDADNKTPIEEIGKVFELFDAGFDIVIGSRASVGSVIERKQSICRRLGSKLFSLVMHALVGLPEVSDTQCGFKFFRRDVAVSLFERQRIKGYMVDVEILLLAKESGYRLAQMPIRWRDDGDSRLQLVRGNVQNMVDLLRIRLGR